MPQMEIETGYAVKLFFSTATFMQVYFEAVANALDAHSNTISISISSDGKISPEQLEITIQDNGDGFTDANFEKFRKLAAPPDPYHKGLGRLVYLHYFSSVHVVSVYENTKREFTFADKFKGESKTSPAAIGDCKGSVLRFSGFRGRRLQTYDDLKPSILKEKLIEQFLPLFHSKKTAGNEFKIELHLETRANSKQMDFLSDTQSITLADVPMLELQKFRDNTIDAFEEITMSYMVQPKTSERPNLAAVCVDGRTIPMIKLLSPSAIPVTHSAIFLFQSKLLAGKSDSARQRLVLPENISESMLYRVLRPKISAVLSANIPEIKDTNERTKQHFEERYPHLTGLFDVDTVGLIDRDEAIEQAQRAFLKNQKEVLECDSLDDRTFEKALEISSRTLTEYVLYREIIIKRLSKITAEVKEDDIHSLIVPRFQQFDGPSLTDGLYHNNAWLLDDKFMTFRKILSEAQMDKVMSAITLTEGKFKDDTRPDISLIFSADPDGPEKVDVVIVEVKRREVDDKEGPFAVTQLIKRSEKLVDHCPTIQRAWYFAVIEIDDELTRHLLSMNWTPLFSRGRVFYQEFRTQRTSGPPVPTPVCILSFDALIQDAASRNHTFLELLKNVFKKATATKAAG